MMQDDDGTSFVVTIGGRPVYALIDGEDISATSKLLSVLLPIQPLHLSSLIINFKLN